MKESIRHKLDNLKDRFEELQALLSDADVIKDQHRFRDLSREYAELEPVVKTYRRFEQVQANLAAAREMQKDGDLEIRQMAQEEVDTAQAELEALELVLQKQLLPRDANDSCNVFLEIRAGTGGDEAAIFAGDLFRMYTRYAERVGWKTEVMSERPGEHGGYKEIIARVEGRDVYACTVAVMPEVEVVEDVDINKGDLRIDNFRASGAGGQHVNKTDSAIRITHLPSGIVVECQDERSQHKNRARAMSLLHAKLLDQAQQAQQKEESDTRRKLVGSGDRSEKIRTYNYPQGRVTDHRINLTVYNLPAVMNGNLAEVIQPLINEYQADQLASLAAEA